MTIPPDQDVIRRAAAAQMALKELSPRAQLAIAINIVAHAVVRIAQDEQKTVASMLKEALRAVSRQVEKKRRPS